MTKSELKEDLRIKLPECHAIEEIVLLLCQLSDIHCEQFHRWLKFDAFALASERMGNHTKTMVAMQIPSIRATIHNTAESDCDEGDIVD